MFIIRITINANYTDKKKEVWFKDHTSFYIYAQ